MYNIEQRKEIIKLETENLVKTERIDSKNKILTF